MFVLRRNFILLILVNFINHNVYYIKSSFIITITKNKFQGRKDEMMKNKILVYLLSTALITPTFVTQTAHADDSSHKNKNQDKVERHQTQTKDSAQSLKSHSDKEDNKQSNDNHDKKDSDKTSSHSSKENGTNSKNQTTTDVTDQNYKAKNNNLVNHIYNSFNRNQTNLSKYWKSDKYDDSFSLTSLIQNLFNFDSDISDYEQSQDQDKNTTNPNNSSQQSSQSNKEEQPSTSQQDHASQHVSIDNSSDDQQTSDGDDANISDKLGELNKDDSNKENTSKQQSSTTNQPNDNHKQPSDKKYSSVTDSALDSILDEYSEDAKKTQKDYHHKSSTNDAKSKTQYKNQKNPQLPSLDELKHKSKPVQSFENDVKQSNTRSTSLFQQLPQIDNGEVSSDSFNVVDSKDTRDFIKSIAKDAHKIGKEQDIYASVMMAQAILESDSGKSALAQSPNYNLFGVKGAYNGQSVTFNTLEADSGNNMFNIQASFRKYPSTKESLEDYADLIKHGIDGNLSIYKPTWKSETLTYKDATSHLSYSYATDPNYAKKLNSIIKHYHLTAFDKKKMPNLKKYNQSIGTDASGSDFKPFVESTSTSPYPHGQCTWYVYNRMNQYDSSISGDLGDAHNWNNRAESKGYKMTHSPKNHTVVVFEAGQLGADMQYGHVAFVEKVNDDGSIVISESNVKGLGVISYRTIDADDASDLDYIQGK